MIWFDLLCRNLIWFNLSFSILFYSYSTLFQFILFLFVLFYSILIYCILIYCILIYCILIYCILIYSILIYSLLPYSSLLFYSMRVCCIMLEGLLPLMQQLPSANSKIDRTCVQQPFSMKLIRGRESRGHTLNKVRISVEVQRSRGEKFLKKILSIYTWRKGLEIGSVILRLPHRLRFW